MLMLKTSVDVKGWCWYPRMTLELTDPMYVWEWSSQRLRHLRWDLVIRIWSSSSRGTSRGNSFSCSNDNDDHFCAVLLSFDAEVIPWIEMDDRNRLIVNSAPLQKEECNRWCSFTEIGFSQTRDLKKKLEFRHRMSSSSSSSSSSR